MENGKFFYYVTTLKIEQGAVIHPGAWGRPLFQGNTYAPALKPNYFILFREYVFEDIRKQKFPNKPSRLTGVFVCPNLISAQNFNMTERSGSGLIYRVELLTDSETHTVPWCLANPPSTLESAFLSIPKVAESYWSFQQEDFPTQLVNMLETITMSPIRICEQIIIDPTLFELKDGAC